MFSNGQARPGWPVAGWFCDHGVLQQPIEQHSAAARLSTIEAERALVQIGVPMSRCDRAVVSSQQPTLQQGGHLMNARHRDMRRIARSRQDDGLVMVIPLG